MDPGPLRLGERVRVVARAHGVGGAVRVPSQALDLAPLGRRARRGGAGGADRCLRCRARARGRPRPRVGPGAHLGHAASLRAGQRGHHLADRGRGAALPVRGGRLAGAGARQRARRGRRAAGPHQAAFPFQQHEHHRRPGTPGPGRGRARGAGPVGPVPRGPGRRQGRIEPGRGSGTGRALPVDRTTAPGRPPAGPLAQGRTPALAAAVAPPGVAAPRRKRGFARDFKAPRGRHHRHRGDLRPRTPAGQHPQSGPRAPGARHVRRGPLEPRAGSGHAQTNIAHRLAYTFGPKARVHGRWHEGYYLAELRVPLPAGGRS